MTHEQMIIADTGCTPEDAALVEDIMRNEIFHSTLDWQTRAQLRKGAREAYAVLADNREVHEEYARRTRDAFEQMRSATAGTGGKP